MAKTSGLGDNLYVGGYDLSGDVGSLGNISGTISAIDVTGINKYGFERIGGLRSGTIEFVAFFNTDAGQAHPVLSALPTSDVDLMYARGTDLGGASACMRAKQIGYDPTRGNDGSMTFAVSATSNGFGLEWGRLLTAGPRTDDAATDGDSVDMLVGSTSYGLQAYLQVFSFTGTDVTVKLQESSDDAVGDAFADVTGGAFTQVTAGPVTERIVTARDQTVERYLRVVTETSGGFDELVFAVVVVRNDTEVAF